MRCNGSTHLAASKSSACSSLSPSITVRVFSSSAERRFLTFFLTSRSSSNNRCALTRARSKSVSGCLPIDFTAFFNSAATKESPSSLIAPVELLSSSSIFSRMSAISPLISLNRDSYVTISARSAVSSLLCTRSNGRICPAQPSGTSTSLPPFFLTTMLASTLRTASWPSLCMVSRSVEMVFCQLSSST